MLAADAEASVQTSSMPDITQSFSQKKGQKQKTKLYLCNTEYLLLFGATVKKIKKFYFRNILENELIIQKIG